MFGALPSAAASAAYAASTLAENARRASSLPQRRSPTTRWACTPRRAPPSCPRARLSPCGETSKSRLAKVQALLELLLVVVAALEEAIHHHVLVVAVPHFRRKVLQVFLDLRRDKGALAANSFSSVALNAA